VQELADHVIAERGVRHGQVVYLPAHGAHTHSGGGTLKGSHTHRRRA
jgi:hypothetical protein